MISLILPYWDRQEAADKALRRLADTYPCDKDLEVIVVDDGNAVPFVVPSDVIETLNVRVVRLPQKDRPTPQSKAWNEGVKAARGSIIALSCVEILHNRPVLHHMAHRLAVAGSYGYILAAAWCPEQQQWHCHSTTHLPMCPQGTGPSFLGMMYVEMFEYVGGFDEDYTDGAGYEDRDFIWRMLHAGAKFQICDDLIVTHPKTGAHIAWPVEGFIRNEVLFKSKWPRANDLKPITVVCLKAGNVYGPEYVNILHDMVRRNLPDGYPGRFVCMTDDPTGIAPGIELLQLPSDLDKWWGKLWMFKRGLFADGERMLFMDLDTAVIGSLEDVVKYDGQFATLRDFYFPERLGPAIVVWEAGGLASAIWDDWVTLDKPRNDMGDLWWINKLGIKADVLQDLYPGTFVSFKVDCNPVPPPGTKVVCFHGQPKPDNCGVDWVDRVWRIGGSHMGELIAVANTDGDTVERNVRSACSRPLQWMSVIPSHEKQAVIVAGGPSLKNTFDEVMQRHSAGQTIIAVNGSARFLNERGIIPDIHIIIDSRPDNAKFVRTSVSDQYFLASQCDPETFDAAETDRTVLFHMNTAGIGSILPPDREANLVSSGSTVGLAAMAVAYAQGYRVIHLHGFDSSYEDQHHAYSQPANDNDDVIEATVGDRTFKAAPWMVKQTQDFQILATQLADADVIITVAGDGLLPYVAHCMSN